MIFQIFSVRLDGDSNPVNNFALSVDQEGDAVSGAAPTNFHVETMDADGLWIERFLLTSRGKVGIANGVYGYRPASFEALCGQR